MRSICLDVTHVQACYAWVYYRLRTW